MVVRSRRGKSSQIEFQIQFGKADPGWGFVIIASFTAKLSQKVENRSGGRENLISRASTEKYHSTHHYPFLSEV